MVTGRIPGALGISEATGRLLNVRRPLGFAGTAAIPSSSEPFGAFPTASVRLGTSPTGGLPRREAASKILGAARKATAGEQSREGFRVEVKQAQVHYLVSQKGRVFFDDLPDAELEPIEGEYRMRRVAAQACRHLLAAARAALSEGQAARDGRALGTRGIRVLSSYRSYAHDTRAWNAAFDKHYEKTREHRAGLVGGSHGDAAVAHLMRVLKGKKAPPGYSNHSNGLAVDFGTSFEGNDYATNSDEDHRAGWRRTWFHGWLRQHARRFGFQPLETEEWHWDYR